MKKIVRYFFIALTVLVSIILIGLTYFFVSFPKTDEPSDIKVERTNERIERGKYLANHVAVCIDCHSKRDWSKFSGPVVSGTEGKGGEVFNEDMGLPGTIYSGNITPASIGNWTDGELIRAIACGVNKKNKALFPLMPYPSYNQFVEEDLYSIVAYLRSLPAIKNDVPESKLNFPLNLIVKTIPLKSYTPVKSIDKSNVVEYGKYLAKIASCIECHTPQEKGQSIKELELAGGMKFGLPSGILKSANITFDNETGIGSWSKEKFLNRFKSFASDSAKNIPADIYKTFNTVMPWTMFAGMKDEDLSAIYEYLKTVSPKKNKILIFDAGKKLQ